MDWKKIMKSMWFGSVRFALAMIFFAMAIYGMVKNPNGSEPVLSIIMGAVLMAFGLFLLYPLKSVMKIDNYPNYMAYVIFSILIIVIPNIYIVPSIPFLNKAIFFYGFNMWLLGMTFVSAIISYIMAKMDVF